MPIFARGVIIHTHICVVKDFLRVCLGTRPYFMQLMTHLIFFPQFQIQNSYSLHVFTHLSILEKSTVDNIFVTCVNKHNLFDLIVVFSKNRGVNL